MKRPSGGFLHPDQGPFRPSAANPAPGAPPRFLNSQARFFLLLCVLSLFIYWPGLNNGFISDDYVLLERAGELAKNPLYLFEIPPENFRFTTYLAFLSLKSVAGFSPGTFYLFSILLHALVAFLWAGLLKQVTEDDQIGIIGGLVFVAVQNPAEAVLWLSAMNEILLAFFLLLTLHCWLRAWWGAGLLSYGLALTSKESAPIILLLIPLLMLWKGERFRFTRAYGGMLIVTGAWMSTYLASLESNSLISGGFYAISASALPVLLISLHKLALPWLYALAPLQWTNRKTLRIRELAGALFWMSLTLLPYIFLTYQNQVPSRHEYLASLGLAAALATLIRNLPWVFGRHALVLVFIMANLSYIWLRKDGQFEDRAAPTTQLLGQLQTRAPSPTLILDFPLNPFIAKLTTRLNPPWEPQMIVVDEPLQCEDCPTLRWNQAEARYEAVASR